MAQDKLVRCPGEVHGAAPRESSWLKYLLTTFFMLLTLLLVLSITYIPFYNIIFPRITKRVTGAPIKLMMSKQL